VKHPDERLARLYLETTVVSYVTSRPSRDLLVLARQEVTRTWWQRNHSGYRIFVSPFVLDEVGRGDPLLAKRRMELLKDATVLDPQPGIELLARQLIPALQIPKKSGMDAVHVAFAIHYELHYLLTWNCAHLANAQVLRLLTDLARREGLWLPIICTPEEMIEERK